MPLGSGNGVRPVRKGHVPRGTGQNVTRRPPCLPFVFGCGIDVEKCSVTFWSVAAWEKASTLGWAVESGGAPEGAPNRKTWKSSLFGGHNHAPRTGSLFGGRDYGGSARPGTEELCPPNRVPAGTRGRKDSRKSPAGTRGRKDSRKPPAGTRGRKDSRILLCRSMPLKLGPQTGSPSGAAVFQIFTKFPPRCNLTAFTAGPEAPPGNAQLDTAPRP